MMRKYDIDSTGYIQIDYISQIYKAMGLSV